MKDNRIYKPEQMNENDVKVMNEAMDNFYDKHYKLTPEQEEEEKKLLEKMHKKQGERTMLVREYLSALNPQTRVTFVKERARKDASSPFYHGEFQTTPLFTVEELTDSRLLDYIILNDEQPPIEWLSGAGWVNGFNKGQIKSLLIISREDFNLLLPSDEQAESIIKYIDKKIKEKNNEKDN